MSKVLDVNINERLVTLLEKYEMQVEQIEDYFFVDGKYPGIVAQLFELEKFEDSVVIQLDITILLPEKSFVESFVSHALTQEEAIIDAIAQFELNVFHTFIVAFWKNAKKVEKGIGTDVWEINGEHWQVVVSNYGVRGVEEFSTILDELDNIFLTVQKNLKAEKLTESIYAIRTVYTNAVGRDNVVEAYINNEPYTQLQEDIALLNWKESENFYAVRNLVLLMKIKQEA
jgi:hypothetical protein